MSHRTYRFIQAHYRKRETRFRLYRLLQEINREIGPAMGKLADAGARAKAKKVAHDARAEDWHARLDAMDAAEPDLYAKVESVVSERESDISELEADLKDLASNFPTASPKQPPASSPTAALGDGTPMTVTLSSDAPLPELPKAPQLRIDRSTGDPLK